MLGVNEETKSKKEPYYYKRIEGSIYVILPSCFYVISFSI